MKYRTLFIVGASLIALFGGCSKRTAHHTWTSGDPMIIQPGVSIGPVHSGMTMQQVVAELGEPDQKLAGGVGLVYRKLGLSVTFGNGGIVQTAICAGDTGFKGHTKEGIGIGASHAEIVKVYGEPTSTRTDLKPFEAMTYDSEGVTFTLRDDKVHMISLSFKP